MSQKFKIELTLVTECDEDLSPEAVKHWVEENFDGCDVGQIEVGNIIEE